MLCNICASFPVRTMPQISSPSSTDQVYPRILTRSTAPMFRVQASDEFFGTVGVERSDVRVVALEPEIALSRRRDLNEILVASRHGYAFDNQCIGIVP